MNNIEVVKGAIEAMTRVFKGATELDGEIKNVSFVIIPDETVPESDRGLGEWEISPDQDDNGRLKIDDVPHGVKVGYSPMVQDMADSRPTASMAARFLELSTLAMGAIGLVSINMAWVSKGRPDEEPSEWEERVGRPSLDPNRVDAIVVTATAPGYAYTAIHPYDTSEGFVLWQEPVVQESEEPGVVVFGPAVPDPWHMAWAGAPDGVDGVLQRLVDRADLEDEDG